MSNRMVSQVAAASCRAVTTRIRQLLLFVAAFAAVLSPGASADASELNIEDYRWNLDGLARHGVFNQLAVLVSNVSATDFDGNLRFSLGGAVGSTREMVQPLFLAKGQSTRVIFDVYMGSFGEGGVLRWGRRQDQSWDVVTPTCIWPHQHVDVKKDALKLPPVVWIESSIGLRPSAGGAVQVLGERWFPVTAAALPTDSVVALAKDPTFQPAQRQAFADWVRLGGTVYLFKEGDAFDTFSDDLAFLNLNTPRQSVGKGVVIRESRNVTNLKASDWKEIALGLVRDRYTPQQPGSSDYNDYSLTNLQVNFSDSVYQALSIVHRPKVVWPLIFTLFFVYIAAVVGGGIFVSRKTRDWKATYATLGALIAGFSALFWYVGARGHGEETEALTIAIADVIDSGEAESRARVQGWTQYFTTASGRFDLKPVLGRTGFRPRENSGAAQIVDGPEGLYRRRIPVFAAASFEWQGLASMKAPVVTELVRGENKKPKFRIDGLGAEAVVKLVHNGRVGNARRNNDGAFVVDGWSGGQPQGDLEPQYYEISSQLRSIDERPQVRDRVFDYLEGWLFQFSRFTQNTTVADEAKSLDDAAVVLVLDDLPATFDEMYENAVHRGRILYRIPVQFSATEEAISLEDRPSEVLVFSDRFDGNQTNSNHSSGNRMAEDRNGSGRFAAAANDAVRTLAAAPPAIDGET